MGTVGFLTLLIAGVGVANIMYVVVKERTREIGIKMAVGARRSYILLQFVFEALLIAFIGGAIGLAFSWGGGVLRAHVTRRGRADAVSRQADSLLQHHAAHIWYSDAHRSAGGVLSCAKSRKR